jgi:hypothetical protein
MSLPTYDAISIRLDIPYRHDAGHYKRSTRSGIRQFLMTTAKATTAQDPGWPHWYQFWRIVKQAKEYQREIGVVIPPHLWNEDRARLGALLARPTGSQDLDLRLERERALRWTRR